MVKSRILQVFHNTDYNPEWQKFSREAVRAIIIKNKKIALVKSKTDGFYKFPGGGVEPGENHFDALIRETREETGLNIIPRSIAELGAIHEQRKSLYGDEIFDQKSYYYYADAEDTVKEQSLDEYEKDLGYELIWEDIETAYNVNVNLGRNCEASFLTREAWVLKYLLDNG